MTDWRKAAVTLGERLPRARLHPAVIRWAERAPPQSWSVALSGGSDSVALVLLVWAHWPEQRRRLTALHFNHRLRAREADRDESFCRGLSQALGIRFMAARWAEPPPDPAEAEARRVRHEFFRKALVRRRCKTLWFGHQQDDIAEMMLMRLARGSGSGGLSAPRPVQPMPDGRVHLRPLLSLAKSEIERTLTQSGIRWREDGSNATRRFLRNRVRQQVLPTWYAATPDRDARAGVALSRELLEEDDAALNAWCDELAALSPDGGLNLRRLAGKPQAVVRRVLHRWLLRNFPEAALSRQAFAAILMDLMRGRVGRHSIGCDRFAVIGKTRLTLENLRPKKSR